MMIRRDAGMPLLAGGMMIAIIAIAVAGVGQAHAEPIDSGWDDDASKPALRIKNGIEIETVTGTYRHQSARDACKKDEFRASTNLTYGTDRVYLAVHSNLYANLLLYSDHLNAEYRYSDRFAVKRNLTVSSAAAEMNFNKLYVNWDSGIMRLRAGNQVFSWGTCDVFNPTSYFNPYDLREFLCKDDDELKVAVPALSLLFSSGKNSLEIVAVPVHVPMQIASNGNFWAIRYQEGPFPVRADQPGELPASYRNAGIGAQFATSLLSADLYLSAYHGPDNDPALRPMQTIVEANRPVSILVKPEYYTVDTLGLSASKSAGKFVLHAEATYAPNKMGVVSQPLDLDLSLPFAVRRSGYLSYATGFNFFIPVNQWIDGHEGNCVFTAEWAQSRFLSSGMMRPLLTDLVFMRLQDSFRGNRLKLQASVAVDTSMSSMVVPAVSYRFDSGVSIDLSYYYITSSIGSILGYYDKNDVIVWRARYEF